jgi:hypothetical protein
MVDLDPSHVVSYGHVRPADPESLGDPTVRLILVSLLHTLSYVLTFWLVGWRLIDKHIQS